ncbi:17660_t:CDS:2 [Funneliformis geosporum]|uniref:19519_t:CDS:1 n=1 Tax=Funneliformis geosporum TaxID=1117311 RepID=A0A9W4STQ6_9GLOM|nr:17660_t:CDS:2 [Funneliformis geosporum]CAI2181160.1 19519_t:CDS:2 [Funneliformis geosporum]
MGGKITGTPVQQRKPRSPPPIIDSTQPSRPPATSIIPPELFITICEPLTPDDLFSLSHVSRYFRDLLCSPNSTATQSIWRKSRLTFLSYPSLPPPPPPPHGAACPDDMDERTYILMTNIAIRCQFCHDRKKQSQIFWSFQVRCCDDCFHQNTISEYNLIKNYNMAKDALCGLPYTSPCNYKIYWKDHIPTAQSDYSLALGSDLLSVWMMQQKAKLERYMNLIERHEWEFKNEMTKWSYQSTLSLQEIRLRSSYMAEEIASDMNLDPEKLRDWGIYWYPMDTNIIRDLTEDDWNNWRVEVETECKKIRRKSQKWFNRFSRASITS